MILVLFVSRSSFETGFGNWIQLQNDQFDWSLSSGGTGSVDTGPLRDHTLQEEHGRFIVTPLLLLIYCDYKEVVL